MYQLIYIHINHLKIKPKGKLKGKPKGKEKNNKK